MADMTKEEALARIAELEQLLLASKEGEKVEENDDAAAFVAGVALGEAASVQLPALAVGVPKGHLPSKPHAGRTYTRLGTKLLGGLCIPQQQADLATILIQGMELGVPYSEEYVFGYITEHAREYASLRGVQDPCYVFRYYRGLVKAPKHYGFIARKFLRQIG
jgi:hypothetical protein